MPAAMRTSLICKITLTIVGALLVLGLAAYAQESMVKGNIAGVVTDSTGALVAGAKVSVEGATGTKTTQTDDQGRFSFPLLIPGRYDLAVNAEKGFKKAEVMAVEVVTGKTAQVTVRLEAGAASETVEVRADATQVDVSSSAVGANLTDEFYGKVPVARNVASLFYTSPGVADGGGTGNANPSISGSSGLENSYIADGVNITNSAYGALGVYTQNQGSVGSGINLSFIKEVDVKTGGFEPQYGQATGGVIQIVTKSGSGHFHGALVGYVAPTNARATERYRDDVVQISRRGERVALGQYEMSGELGGYVPGLREHLFFFGSFDPSYTHSFWTAPAPIGGLVFSDLKGVQEQRTNTYNYAGKLTYRINDRHSVEGSIFGDPSHTGTGQLTPVANLAVFGTTAFSKWEYGTRNIVGRYNGTLSPTWLVNANYSRNTNYFHENPSSDVFNIVDTSGGAVTALQGFGRLEQHNATSNGISGDTSKVVNLGKLGTHTFSTGYHWENPHYDNIQNRSGGQFAVPAVNFQGQSYLPSSNPPAAGAPTDAQFQLEAVPLGNDGVTPIFCPLCPTNYGPAGGAAVVLVMTRGQFGGSGLKPTRGIYQDAYVNDNWAVTRRINLSLGLRWEQQHVAGTLAKYTFTDNWSPRMGFTIDPWADRKTKIYGNYGKYSYAMPLDVAIRSLSGENDLNNVFFVPDIGANNSVTVTPDSAHIVSGTGDANGTFALPSVSTASLGENFLAGSKMTYEREFLIGAEHEWRGIVFSARYIDRKLQRIIEDFSGTSPEGSQLLAQNFMIGNPSPSLDAYQNEVQVVIPAGTPEANFPTINPGCLADGSNTIGVNKITGIAGPVADANGNQFSSNSICMPNFQTADQLGPDGKPDGFVQPKRHYSAIEVEVNKSFSKNYLMRFNYRYAKLIGNYEGAFRNDNGQSDPGISSLFDFTPGQYNLLGDQFRPGYLSTDRRNVFNAFFSYTFPNYFTKGLTVGTSLKVQTGTPLSILADHPAYGNAGEVPVGGRGAAGVSPTTEQLDLKLDYPRKIGERFTLHFGIDMFNLANAKNAVIVDQARDLSFQPAGSNTDFLKPGQTNGTGSIPAYQDPFYARFTVMLQF